MKNARIKRLSFSIALALTGTQLAGNAAADIDLPEPPPVELFDGFYTASSANESAVAPIEYGSPTSGAIGDANDYIGSDGVSRSDYFAFEVTDPSSGYVVTLRSDSFTALSALWFVDKTNNKLIREQTAFVSAPGKQVQYSGTLPQTGTWLIEVTPIDDNQGNYSVSLDSAVSGPVGSAGCEAPGSENPFVEVSPGVTLDCNLSAEDPFVLESNAGKHHAKGFHFIGNGASVTIRAASSAFTSTIVLMDPATGQVLDIQQGELSGAFTGDVFYLVTSAEPGASGPFTTGIESGDPNSGGFLRPSDMAPSIEQASHYEIVD
ncbi:MAG: hypothetical protein U9R74_00585 [Pseudomonadota bacterium]|nr:hypothetical protein [Pseudomonadota bacterium]